MARLSAKVLVCLSLAVFISACTTLVAPYDATFDQSLNKLSEDSAKFVAAASAGGAERSYSSKQAVEYYASTYNVLDRLIARAALSRGSISCPTDESLKAFVSSPASTTVLPEDYLKLDCREFQLYSVRIFANQLEYGHKNDGVLNKSEATALGGALQTSILGAIQTFVVNKPSN